MTNPNHRADFGQGTRWIAAASTVVVTALFGVLLHHLVFRGWAHSYDSAIYVRSLWGVANGDLTNPWVDLHVLSIHANFVLFLLAPLTVVLHPATVLLGAQSLAIGVTVGMVAAEVLAIARAGRMDRCSTIAACAVVVCGVTVGAPLVVNPFVFDIRPDLIGIPLLTYGLLRARRRGEFDLRAVAPMLASLLVREEYMMVIVGAMAIGPIRASVPAEWRLRLATLLLAVGYWALYWFGFRNWIGDGSYAIAQEVGAAFLDETELGAGRIVGYKLEILFAFVASAGGLLLLGWRWVGPALPGLLFLLISSRMQDLILNFHYVMFVIPGVLVASVHGFERWSARVRHPIWSPLAASALITITFVWSSALPGGGRFRAENFYLFEPDARAAHAELLRAHDLVARVPEDVGVALPHELAAPVADRALARPIALFTEQVSIDEIPPGIDWVVLPGANWASVGRMLVDLHGFTLVGFEDSRLALLTRDPSAELNWTDAAALDNPARCQSPLAAWPAAGFRLCGIEPRSDGRARITVIRNDEVDARVAGRPLVFLARPLGAPEFVPAFLLRGLVNAMQIPMGGSGVFLTEAPVVDPEHRALEIALTFTDGGAVPAILPGSDERVGAVTITW